MYCKNCGKELKQGTMFCSECGTAIQGTTNTAPSVNVNNVSFWLIMSLIILLNLVFPIINQAQTATMTPYQNVMAQYFNSFDFISAIVGIGLLVALFCLRKINGLALQDIILPACILVFSYIFGYVMTNALLFSGDSQLLALIVVNSAVLGNMGPILCVMGYLIGKQRNAIMSSVFFIGVPVLLVTVYAIWNIRGRTLTSPEIFVYARPLWELLAIYATGISCYLCGKKKLHCIPQVIALLGIFLLSIILFKVLQQTGISYANAALAEFILSVVLLIAMAVLCFCFPNVQLRIKKKR